MIKVHFEEGAEQFSCEPMSRVRCLTLWAASPRPLQIAAEARDGDAYGNVTQLASAVGQCGPVEGSQFHSAIQESLLQLAGVLGWCLSGTDCTGCAADISRLQDEALDRHMKDLDEMEEQVLPQCLCAAPMLASI